MKANGYYTIAVGTSRVFIFHLQQLIKQQSVHGATRKNLLKIKGFSEIKVEKIKDAIIKCLVCHYPCFGLAKSDQL